LINQTLQNQKKKKIPQILAKKITVHVKLFEALKGESKQWIKEKS